MIDKIKKIVKKNKSVEKVCKDINGMINFNPNIGEITPLNARETNYEKKRINLLVPSINQEHIFGGISTALKFFEQLTDELGYERRIITTDASPSKDDMSRFKSYSLVEYKDDIDNDYQVVAFNDRYNKTIPIGKNDIFVSTAWWTAYAAHNLIRWQAAVYNQEVKKSIYFIQDYEPGFYPWSSRYALAESTYKIDLPQIAIFNTSLLRDFFKHKGYEFAEEYYFEPTLNEKLKECLLNIKEFNKKKQILIYGRPSVDRNAFELIVESLRQWVWSQPDIKEWKIYSVGEKHPNIDLGNEVKLESLGKLTLEEYATLMSESYLGISLMISPHPSYPPLEMSTFGMKVITNSYDNKNIEEFNNNITSIECLNPNYIKIELMKLCTNFDNVIPIKGNNDDYITKGKLFDFITKINL